MTPIPRDTPRPPPPAASPQSTGLDPSPSAPCWHTLADVLAARPELHKMIPDPERPRPERTTR